MKKNIAIILAGGKGVRLGEQRPKQLLKIAGRKVIEHTLEVFETHPEIDEVAVVSNPDHISDIEEIAKLNSFTKLKKILNGGAERYDSSLSAINAYSDQDVNLIFHDAVRPLVNHRIISDCITALQTYNAVDVAIKTTDTIIQVQDNLINEIPNRDFLYNGQTPQAFAIGTIKRAYELALQDPNFRATDDCGVVKRYIPEEKIYVVHGEQFNMKLTYKEDVFLIDKLFQLKSSSGTGGSSLSEGIQSTLKNKVLVVFGGSYGIGKEILDLSAQAGAKGYSFSRSNDVDVSSAEQVAAALKSVYDKEGRIDFVVNTAAVLDKQSLTNMSYEDIIKSININYLGSVIVAKESFKYLNESKGAVLLYTSSSYTRGRSLYSIYSSTKAAIVNLVQALCEEWPDVRINCINPERTKTPMRVKNFGNEADDSLLRPEVVAVASINTLFSDKSGQVIDVKL